MYIIQVQYRIYYKNIIGMYFVQWLKILKRTIEPNFWVQNSAENFYYQTIGSKYFLARFICDTTGLRKHTKII